MIGLVVLLVVGGAALAVGFVLIKRYVNDPELVKPTYTLVLVYVFFFGGCLAVGTALGGLLDR